MAVQNRDGLTRAELLLGAAGAGLGLLLGPAGSAGADVLGGAGRRAARQRTASLTTTQSFYSRPDLHPPTIDVLHPSSGTAPGYLMLAPSSGPGQRGVMIIDDAGELLWFRSTAPQTAMNLRVARYEGQPVLTWWEGKSQKGTGVGECVIVDGSYRELARFKPSNGSPLDLHDFIITAENTALVTSNEIRRMNLTSLGGRSSWPVMGGLVLELEIPSGRVLWEWHSLDHVALDESHQKIGPSFDYFHVNSIDVAPDGNLIVSARNTWAVYKINRTTGAVMWRLGGKKSDFAMGKNTVFAWQHDARIHDGGSLLSIFDDGAAPKVEPQSRALVIALDTARMRATLARRFVHHPPLLARYTGSAQMLGNGDLLVGWGSAPNFTEFAADGEVRFDARLPNGGQTYRVLRFPWTGHPADPPMVVARTTAAGSRLYASWNGATAGTYPRRGFETELPVGPDVASAAAVALDASGTKLARSAAIAV
jgi:hypothetical protein